MSPPNANVYPRPYTVAFTEPSSRRPDSQASSHREPADLDSSSGVAATPLSVWRARIVARVLHWSARMGVVAYLPGLALSLHLKLWNIALADTFVFASIVGFRLGHARLSHQLRATGFLAILYSLAVFLVAVVAPLKAGPTISSTALLWLIIAGNFLFLASVTPLSIAAILRGLHKELEAAQADELRVRQTQKLEAIETLAGGIAHHLNNALQPILTYVTLVQRDLGENHPANQDLQIVQSAVARARDLVGRVLTFSGKSVRRRQALSVSDALLQTVASIQPTLPAGVELVSKIDTDDDTIDADPFEVQQIIVNLCTNAAFAMKESGGRISLRLDAPPAGEVAEGGANRNALGLRLTVTDSGPGMPPRIVQRAFEPFFTTKPPGEGIGLGLSSVYGMVESLGGSVRLSSIVGVGTTVEVFFPLQRLKVAQAARPVSKPFYIPALTPPSPLGHRVLLVEDEPTVRAATNRLLTRLGYHVTPFDSALPALAALREEPLRFHVLITGVNLPQISGVELAREARALHPELGLIFAAGFLEGAQLLEARKLGHFELLRKPFEPTDLVQALQQAFIARDRGEASSV